MEQCKQIQHLKKRYNIIALVSSKNVVISESSFIFKWMDLLWRHTWYDMQGLKGKTRREQSGIFKSYGTWASLNKKREASLYYGLIISVYC